MARPPSKQPTDGELEILKVLWDHEPDPVGLGRIVSTLNEARPLATTTVATVLKSMLDKGLVSREGTPKGYAWSAGVTRKAAASGLIGKVVAHIFDGSSRLLVAHMIQDGKLDERERLELLELLKAGAPS